MTTNGFRYFICLLFFSCFLPACDQQAIQQTISPGGSEEAAVAQDGYLFCFWNVENLFDDKDDGRKQAGDKEYDPWMAKNHPVLAQKLANHCQALLSLNEGKGPDILAVCEVENVRAAQLLQAALNQRLGDPRLHYKPPVMQEVSVGRHIAPAILTRLPLVNEKNKGFGSRFRMVQGTVAVGQRELVVLASHWTSRLQEGNEKGRAEYADQLYANFVALHRHNPAVDLLICGDFNDTPQDVSVTQHLHASADRQAVLRSGNQPILYNLFADKDPGKGFGTHSYSSKWYIFDQIVVSPGLLDNQGWTCDPASARTVNTLVRPGDKQGRPWRFGTEKDQMPRGFSDHFPVTVRLQIR